MGPVGWVAQGVRGNPFGSSPAIGMRALGLPDTVVHAFVFVLQGVVTTGVVEMLPYFFSCGVSGERDLNTIWGAVARVEGRK